MPDRVAQAEPEEVGDFMDENAREFAEGAVEGNAPFAEERTSVDRAAGVAEAAQGLDANRCSHKDWQPAQHGTGAAFQYAIFEAEGLRRHSL